MEIVLNDSGVIFNEVEHTYTLGEKKLSGITRLIHNQLFKNEFDGVPIERMEAKAEFGHKIHGEIELYDSGINLESEYVSQYQAIKNVYGLTTVANEYIVTDREHYASGIDIVMHKDDDGIWLVDTKTVYTVNKEKVAWQLSIYKYLFELQNPELNVKGIACLWFEVRKGELKDTHFIDLTAQMKSKEDVIRLLDCEINGEQFLDTTSTELVVPVDVVDKICELENTIADLTAKRNEIRDALLRLMQDNDVKSFKNDRILLTRKLATTTKRFDSARFKKENKELYEQYLKESTSDESILIKVYDTDKDA